MKLAIVIGTRPEIIKCSPVIKECEIKGVDYFVLHTGQHYSYEMDRIFFDQLGLPDPDHKLDISSHSSLHGEQTGKMLMGIEKILMEEKPSLVLVQGDTNTVLAGALATRKLATTGNIKLGHIEACLRSYDRSMPEETNRVLADHMSDFLYAPTEKSVRNAVNEGIPREKITVTGNTIVDAVREISDLHRTSTLDMLGLEKNDYFLATAHRQENVDSAEKLRNILKGLDMIGREHGKKVVYPVHPRTRNNMNKFGIAVPDGITITEPLGFFEFFDLEKNALLVLTDSGGVQEESCIMGVPCVTLRDNTERPETLDAGSNILAGTDPGRIAFCVGEMLSRKRKWSNPFGDGHAAERIISHAEKSLS